MKKCTKMVFFLVVLSTLLLTFNLAYAHSNARPMYGGMVETVGDTSFELVVNDDGVDLYILEEGIEISTTGKTAKVIINDNGTRSEFMLEPVGGNRFSAKGATIPSGAAVSVMLTNQEPYSKIGVKFIIE